SALAAGLISGSAASSRSGFSTPHLKQTFIALSLSGFPFGAPPYILGGAPSVKREVVVLVLEWSANRRGFRLLFRQRREPIDGLARLLRRERRAVRDALLQPPQTVLRYLPLEHHLLDQVHLLLRGRPG